MAAHSNYLENLSSVVPAILIAGIQYPLSTDSLGAFWITFRIVYAVGYTDENKTRGEGRLYGTPFWLAQLGLFGLAGWTGVKMVM